jgi:hypothetical protein
MDPTVIQMMLLTVTKIMDLHAIKQQPFNALNKMELILQMEVIVFQMIILLAILIEDPNVIHQIVLFHGVTLIINQILVLL